MIMIVRFCLSYDKQYLCLSFYHLQSLFISVKICNCYNGRRHDVTCSRRMCYITCGHNIVYDMTLFTW